MELIQLEAYVTVIMQFTFPSAYKQENVLWYFS